MNLDEFKKRYDYNPHNDHLGEGSFGKVYKAYDTVLDRYVAIKIADHKLVGERTYSLQDEFNALGGLPDHANIAKYEQLYTYESVNGVFDIAVMQYYADGNLSQLIRNRNITFEQKEQLALQLLDGIAFLHSHQVVHRDLKPSNILIHNRQLKGKIMYIPKITDFGLSKKVQYGQNTYFDNSHGAGTYAYSSPEQLKGDELRLNTDWWAYGAIVYEIFTGDKMFLPTNAYSANTAELLNNILKSDIAPKINRLPKKWRAAITACLQRDVKKRVKTALELRALLVEQSDATTVAQSQLEATQGETTRVSDATTVAQTKSPVSSSSHPLKATSLRVASYGGKYGFVDKSGREVIPIKYDDAGSFSEGLAKVRLRGKYGFIDTSGREVVPFKYDAAGPFSKGLAMVRLGGKWGSIDKSGRVVIPIKYDLAGYFSEGLALVKLDGYEFYIDKEGYCVKGNAPAGHPRRGEETNAGDATTVAQPQLEATQGKTTRVSDATTVAQTKPKPSVASPIGERDDSKPQPRRKWIFIALGILLAVVIILVVKQVAGNESTPLNADGTEEFTENLVPKYLGGKFGFIDKSGREVIPFKYERVSSFSEGLALVKLGGKWGSIDKSGREVIPIKYDDVYSFSEGLAVVKLNGKRGFIDTSGREVTPIKYDDAGSFSEGLAVVKLNGKRGFIDTSGREVTPIKYDLAGYFFRGLARVKLGGKWGFIDKSGRVVIPIKYDDVYSFSEGLARVLLGDKYGFIDTSGREVVPFKYDWAGDFSEGLARVELGDKYGFIDKSGREVIPFRYDYADSFSEGLALVKLGGKWGSIDKSGREVISIKYDDVGSFSEGLARVKLGGKWGFIDKSGREVIPFKYDSTGGFSEGLAVVKLGGKFGFVDKSGREVIPIEYDLAWYFSEGLAEVWLGGYEFYIDKEGYCVKGNAPAGHPKR